MIVNWFWTVAANVVAWVMTLVPDWAVPDSVLHYDRTLNDYANTLQGVGVFVPWIVLGAAIAAPMALWGLLLGWRAFRTGFSHMPFIGGR